VTGIAGAGTDTASVDLGAVGAVGEAGTAAVTVGVGGAGETGTLDGAGAMSDAVAHPPAGAMRGANHPPTVTVLADGQGGH
jgi:hypothetical protein